MFKKSGRKTFGKGSRTWQLGNISYKTTGASKQVRYGHQSGNLVSLVMLLSCTILLNRCPITLKAHMYMSHLDVFVKYTKLMALMVRIYFCYLNKLAFAFIIYVLSMKTSVYNLCFISIVRYYPTVKLR